MSALRSTRRPADQPAVDVETITPELATKYLGHNTRNRNLRARVVLAYAADMANGDWRWNGEGIKFGTDGTLLDGQHRLAAIVQSGTSVPMLVVRDLPNETQETIDGGVKRTFADVLNLRGEKNYVGLAATIRAITSYETGAAGTGDTGRKFTNAQLIRTLEKHPWIREGINTANSAQAHTSMPTAVGGLAWFLFMQLSPEDTEFFFNRLCSDTNHSTGDPIYTLRKLLLTSVDGVRGARNTRYLLAVTIKAWNKYRDGDRCDLLKFRTGGAKPEAFPEPR